MALPQADTAPAAQTTDTSLRARGITRWYEAALWRRRVATQPTFLERTFRNGGELQHAQREGTPATCATLRDGRTLIHPESVGLPETLVELWHHRAYTQGFYRPRPGDVVVDAGANVGVFSAYLLRRSPTTRVIAIEPSPQNLPALRHNIAQFGGNCDDIVDAALGPTAGTASLHTSVRSLDHRVDFVRTDADHAQRDMGPSHTVRVVTLEQVMDDAQAHRLALLKLDIEGAEFMLLDGMRDATLARCDRIAIEPHPRLAGRPAQDLVRRLTPLFRVRWYGPILQARRR